MHHFPSYGGGVFWAAFDSDDVIIIQTMRNISRNSALIFLFGLMAVCSLYLVYKDHVHRQFAYAKIVVKADQERTRRIMRKIAPQGDGAMRSDDATGRDTSRKATFAYFRDDAINMVFDGVTAIVFDLNGLIVDDEPLQMQATNGALSKVGVSIDEPTWIGRCVGHKPVEYLGDRIREASGELPGVPQIQDLIAFKDEIYMGLMGAEAKKIVRAGVRELMDFAKRNGLLLALATSTTRSGVESVIGDQCLGMKALFDLVVCGDEVTRGKPAPEIYETVRRHLGEDRRYVVLEDSIIGVRAAKAAGMTCVAVPNRFTSNQDFAGADLILDSLEPSASIRSFGAAAQQGLIALN